MAYLFHHDEFAFPIDRVLKRSSWRYIMERVSPECLSIDVDESTDERFPNFFKFLSDRRVNYILRTVMGHNEPDSRKNYMHSLSTDELQNLTVPYDDMMCTVDGEDLHVVYSIAPIDSPFRKGITGPSGTQLYERNMPHFGLIYVYRSERTEYNDEHGFDHVKHTWLPIAARPERIVDVLSSNDPDKLH